MSAASSPPRDAFVTGRPNLDELAAATVINDYGSHCIVKIPGAEDLTQAERDEVHSRAQQRLTFEALAARLEDVTPPPDSDDDLEEARVLEAQARKDLEAEGCPPCYPADFELPLTDPPPEYLPIIRYFENDGVYLYAQLSEWQRFRQVQEQDRSPTRSRYRSLTFDEWLARIRRRRERNGLSSDVSSIKQSLSQQDRLGNWVEYQDFALKCFQGYYNDKGELEKERDEGLAKGEESWPYERRMEYIEREMEKHKILLQWIEEQRLVMLPPVSDKTAVFYPWKFRYIKA